MLKRYKWPLPSITPSPCLFLCFLSFFMCIYPRKLLLSCFLSNFLQAYFPHFPMVTLLYPYSLRLFFFLHPLFPAHFFWPHIPHYPTISLPSSSFFLHHLPPSVFPPSVGEIPSVVVESTSLSDRLSYWSQRWIFPPTHPQPVYFQPKQTIIFFSLPGFLGD